VFSKSIFASILYNQPKVSGMMFTYVGEISTLLK